MKKQLKTKDLNATTFVTMVTGDIAEIVEENGTATFIFERTGDNLNVYRHFCNEKHLGALSDLNGNIGAFLKIQSDYKKEAFSVCGGKKGY